MKADQYMKYISTSLLVAVVLFIIMVSNKPEIKSSSAYKEYFNESSIMTVDIVIDDAVWREMLDNALQEKYVKCDVIINGERINDVGIRPKGNASLQQVAALGSQRYSFKIEFNHYIKNQTFQGLDKLVLNNTMSDASYMKEFMSYEIFEAAGVAVPLHSYAQIKRNGLDCGLYLALEAMEDSYAKRVYGSDHGQLYKPESENLGNIFGGANAVKEFTLMEDKLEAGSKSEAVDTKKGITDILDVGNGMIGGLNTKGIGLVYTDDEISSYSAIYDSAVFNITDKDFNRVIKAIKNLNKGNELDKYINVDDTLRYFAAQTFLINFDSYYGSLGHNYYLYEKKGQLTMLPWDLNLAFAGYRYGDTKSSVNYPIDTPLSDVTMKERPMLSKLLEVPIYKEKYHKYLKQIVDDYINSNKFSNKISATNQLIKSYVENDSTSFYSMEQYEAAIPVLEKFGLLRAESVKAQLAGAIPSTSDGQAEDMTSLVNTGDLDVTVLNPQVFHKN